MAFTFFSISLCTEAPCPCYCAPNSLPHQTELLQCQDLFCFISVPSVHVGSAQLFGWTPLPSLPSQRQPITAVDFQVAQLPGKCIPVAWRASLGTCGMSLIFIHSKDIQSAPIMHWALSLGSHVLVVLTDNYIGNHNVVW